MKILNYKLFLILIVFFGSANISAAPLSVVQNISFSNKIDHEVLKVFLKNAPEPNVFILENPKRLVIDLENSKIPEVITSKYVKGNIVKQIRTNQFKKNTARIVLDIKKDYDFGFISEKEKKNGYFGLKILIFNKDQDFKDKIIKQEKTSHKKELIQPKQEETRKRPEIQQEKPEPEQIIKDDSADDFNFETETEEIIFAFDDSLTESIFNETPPVKKPDFTISGSIKTKATRDTEKSRDKIENKTSFRNRTIVEAKYKKNLTASVLSDFLYFGDDENFNEYDFDIYELTYQYINPRISLSLGKQIIRWGKTDQLSPVDTLNPEDMREFVTNDYEDRKIPIWMADLKLFSDIFNIEFVYIPFFEKSKYNNFETDWSRFPHLKKEVKQSSMPEPVKHYFNNIKISENEPDNENEYGIRLFKTIKSIDFGITWHRYNEDEPYISSFPIKNLNINGDFSVENLSSSINPADLTNEAIEMDYKKTNAYGFEFETIISGFGLRGEALFEDKKSFLTSDLTSVRKPLYTYVLGVDYSAAGNVYFNAQFGSQHINSYEKNIIFTDKNNYFLFGELSKDFPNHWTKISIEYFIYLNTSSKYFSPKIEYTYFKNLELSLGLNNFTGNDNSGLGRFKNNSQLFLDITYFF